MKIRIIIAGILLFTSIGCAGTARNMMIKETTGKIGCAPQDIEISDENIGITGGTWTAKCKGKTYYCSGNTGGGETHCTEAK